MILHILGLGVVLNIVSLIFCLNKHDLNYIPYNQKEDMILNKLIHLINNFIC